MGAIQGPDYDRYFDSCMTLLLDPKCGDNGWSLEIFFEFDNAHRLQQWHTGSAFDLYEWRILRLCLLALSSHLLFSATQQGTRSAVEWLRPLGLVNRPKPLSTTALLITTPGTVPSSPNASLPTPISAASATVRTSMPPVPAPATSTSSPVLVPTTQDIRRPGQWRIGLTPYKVAWVETLIALRPLNLKAWQSKLSEDSNRNFLLYLVQHGLSLTDTRTPLDEFRCRNYKLAYLAPDAVTAALPDDILRHQIFRPYSGESSKFVHALGAVPKMVTTVWVIHDHSRPYGRSLNDVLSQSTFIFDLVDDAVALMRTKCYMAKVDIEAAHRHVPIDPVD
jgi:hypothetical protein